MPANFPVSLDTWVTKVDNVDTVYAADVNNLQNAVAAVEKASLNPSLRILSAPTGGDDTTLIANAVAALPSGGKIILSGLYSVIAGNIALANANDLTFEGASTVLTGNGFINNGTNPMFVVTGTCARNKFRNLAFKSATGSGHVFSAGSSICSYWKFEDIYVDIGSTPAKSFWSHTGAGMNYIGMTTRDFWIFGSATASVPAWNIVSDIGGANGNVWDKGTSNMQGFYTFWVESNNAGTYAYDNKWRDIIFEVPNAGCIKTLGCMNPIFDTCTAYDLTTSTANLFVVAAGSGAAPRHVTFRNVARHGGALGGGLADIAVAGQDILIEMSAAGGTGALTVDATGATLIIAIGGGSAGITWINRPGSTVEIVNGGLKSAALVTTAGGVIEGVYQIYPGESNTNGVQTSGGFLHNAGVPANGDGNNNDWCISDNGHFYFKTGGSWVQKI